MTRKKILIVIPSFDAGGVEKALINLANGLVASSDVSLLVCVNQGSFRTLVSDQINIIDLKASKLRKALLLLIPFFLKNNFDTVITGPTYCNLFLIFVKKITIAKFQLFITHHNYQDIEMKGWGVKGKIIPFLIKSFYPFANKVIAVSYGIRDELIKSFKIQPSKIEVIYNAVIDERFYKLSDEDLEGYDLNKSNYILFIGRLEKVKNCSLLIKAYSDLLKEHSQCDLNLVVVGDGIERKKLTQLAESLQLSDRITFTGAIDNPLSTLKRAKMLVNSSFSEALPIVLIEAMALNVKIVASQTAGAIEVLGKYNKVRFFPIDDRGFLKEQLYLSLIDEEKSDSKMSNNFDTQFIIGKYLHLINN